MRIWTNNLRTHGAGAYYSICAAQDIGKRGVRLSLGGYGWARRCWQVDVLRYPGVATHLRFGPLCLSFCRSITR